MKKRRTSPTATEINRVQQALERDPVLSRVLGPKTFPVEMRTGEKVFFSSEAVAVALEMMSLKLNPERAALRELLAVAGRLLVFPLPCPHINWPVE